MTLVVPSSPTRRPWHDAPAGWLALASSLVGIRLLCANYRGFWEGDDFSIAAGVLALLRDNIGDIYRYVPQWGYYRLVQLLDVLLGGELGMVPLIMITLSAIAGGLVPALALLSFRSELEPGLRRLLAFVLFVNPILWVSSWYGNTATFSLAFVVAAVAILSNPCNLRLQILALVLFAFGTLIRADAVLVLPLVMLLLFERLRSAREVFALAGGWAVAMSAVYGAILVLDARAQGIVAPVTSHLFNPRFPTLFWEYLIWAFSPIPLLFAAWGFRDVLLEWKRPLAYVTVWCLPVFAFYFASTTTPRYFLLVIVPVSICGVVGLWNLARAIAPAIRPSVAWTVLLALSTLHLFVALGHFTPDRVTNVFRGASLMTHDGPMFTGGWLLRSTSTLVSTLRRPGFDADDTFVADLQARFREMEARRTPVRKVVVLLGGWDGGRFHYQAQLHGAEYISRKPGQIFSAETWLKVGDTRIMTVANWGGDYDALTRLDVDPGDEIWTIGFGEIHRDVHGKLPSGLATTPIADPGHGIHAVRIVGTRHAEGAAALR